MRSACQGRCSRVGCGRHGVELVLVGGRIVASGQGGEAADAIAVCGRRIAAVGRREEILQLAGPRTRVVDVAGGSVIPGVNDSHLHLSWWALARPPQVVDLTGIRSVEELRQVVGARAREAPPGSWVRGAGWSESRLREFSDGRRRPAREDLDDVAPETPVVLEHWTRHAAWANSVALRKAGICAATRDPDGGTIVRTESGEPTGHLLEAAIELLYRAIPPTGRREMRAAIVEAARELSRRGVTSVTDPVVTPELLRDYAALHAEQSLALRLSVLLHWDWPSVRTTVAGLRHALEFVGVTSGFGDEWLRIGGCKLFADGVPALGTAWMSRPGGSGTLGGLVTEGDSDAERERALREMIRVLHRERFQIQVHATGDLACDVVADAFANSMTEDPWPRARHVVIHGNFLTRDAIGKLARHGFICNTNSLIKWQASDALRAVLDESRWHRNMPWREILDGGAHLTDSSDAPITEPDWRQALETLVLRECRGLGAISGPDQRLSREEAIRAWTIEPAYQDGQEWLKGSLERGKRADLVVLAEDVLTVEDHELHAVTPVMTVLDGKIVAES